MKEDIQTRISKSEWKTRILYVKDVWTRNRLAFIVTMCVGAVIHFYIYSNNLLNPDGFWQGEEYIASWEVTSGRWGLELFDRLHAGVNAPILIALIAIAFFSLGGVLLNECFGVDKPWVRILVPLCVISSPMISFTLTYPYCSDAYACAFFLAVLSIFVAIKKPGIPWAVATIACLAYSLGIYQSNLGVAAGVALLVVFFQIMERPDDWKNHRKLLLRLLVVGIGGVTTYWLILKLLLWVHGWTLSSFKGADSVSLMESLKAFPTSAKHAYTDFFDFFARQNIMTNHYFTRFCYGMLFLAFAVFFLRALIKMRHKPLSILCACLLLGLLPLACNAVDIVATQTNIILLTAGGMLVVCPAILAFCTKQRTAPEEAVGRKVVKWGQLVASFVVVVLVWNNALVVNTDAMVMEANTKQTVALANRILTRLEENEDYLSGVPVLVAGVPKDGNYPIVTTLRDTANYYALWSTVWGDFHGNMHCWRQIFRQLLGEEPNWCWDQYKYQEIAATQEFQDMPLFPFEGSIQTIQDYVVVKISNMGE